MTPPDDASDRSTRGAGRDADMDHRLDLDYEAILAAVTETVRGRWFLDEYARRNRTADTRTLLTVLRRIEESVGRTGAAPPGIREAAAGLADMIGGVRVEIASIPRYGEDGAVRRNAEEVDLVEESGAGKAALMRIHESAERIQEIVWNLRERQIAIELCDVLDRHAADIQGACRLAAATLKGMNAMGRALHQIEGGLAAVMELHPSPPVPGADALPGDQTPEKAALSRLLDDIEPVEADDVLWSPSAQVSAGSTSVEDESDERFTDAPSETRSGMAGPDRNPVPVTPAKSNAPVRIVDNPPADLTGLTFDQRMILFS